MGIKTLKTGTSVIVKDNNQKGVISEIQDGKYRLGVSKLWYSSRELVAEKKIYNLKKITTIKKNSEKTSTLKTIYAILGPLWLRHNKMCRARFAGCTVKATEIHHMNGRRGFWLIISKWFFPICRRCHRYATKNSAEAIKAGVTIPDHINPEYEFNNLERELMAKHAINPPI